MAVCLAAVEGGPQLLLGLAKRVSSAWAMGSPQYGYAG